MAFQISNDVVIKMYKKTIANYILKIYVFNYDCLFNQ